MSGLVSITWYRKNSKLSPNGVGVLELISPAVVLQLISKPGGTDGKLPLVKSYLVLDTGELNEQTYEVSDDILTLTNALNSAMNPGAGSASTPQQTLSYSAGLLTISGGNTITIPAGPVGAKGATGNIGIQGQAGPQGLQGIVGGVGSTGIQGPVGAIGNLGGIGPAGPAGSIGPIGPAVDLTTVNTTISGLQTTVTNLSTTVSQQGQTIVSNNNSIISFEGTVYTKAQIDAKIANIPTGTGGASTLTIRNTNNLNLSSIGIQYLSSTASLLGTAVLTATGDFTATYPTGTTAVTFYLIPSAASTNGQVTTTIKGVQGITKSTYTLMYTLGGGAFTDSITAFSFNTPPISVPGANQTVALPSLGIVFAGSGTSTSSGTISSYLWAQVSGPNTAYLSGITNATLNVTRFIAGTYIFSLTVIDNFGLSGSNQVTLQANPPTGGLTATLNQTVVINTLQSGPTIGVPGTQVLAAGTTGLSLTATTTVNISPIAVSTWSQLSGPNTAILAGVRNLQVYISGLVPGTYVFQLLSEDTLGLLSSRTVTVTASASSVPPIVSAGSNQTLTLNATTVSLTGTASTTDGSTITSYGWVTTSGPNAPSIVSASAAITNVTGLIAGSYVFTLTAYASNGLSSSSATTITASQSVSPTVTASANQTLAVGVTTASMVGTATGNAGATIVSTLWSKVSGPAGDVLGTPNALTTGVSGLTTGAYSYKITATDSNGVTASATTVVTATAASVTVYTTNLNFNATPQSVSNWIDVSSAAGTNTSVYTSTIGNGVTLSSVSIANWPRAGGSNTYNTSYTGSSTVVPIAVGQSAWFLLNTGTYDKTLAGAILQFTGCVVGGTYSMQIYCAIDAAFQPSDNFYLSVNGGTDQQPNATANASTLITFPGLVPDASGRLWLSAGFTTTGKYPIINAIIFSRTA